MIKCIPVVTASINDGRQLALNVAIIKTFRDDAPLGCAVYPGEKIGEASVIVQNGNGGNDEIELIYIAGYIWG